MIQSPIQYFIDIDTTFRDRTTSALPSDMIIPVNNYQKGLTTLTLANSNTQIIGSDLVSDQVPIYSIFSDVSGGTDNSGNGLASFFRVDICGNTSQDIDAFVVSDVSGAFQEISGNYYITVDGSTNLVTRADSVGTAVNVVPMTAASLFYKRHLIRKQRPMFSFGTAIGTLGPSGSSALDASGNSFISFTGLPPKSAVDNQFLHVYDPSGTVVSATASSTIQNQSYLFRISYLDNRLGRIVLATNTVFSDTKWKGAFFEILSVTRENNTGMIYQMNRSVNTPLYAINLLSITIPNLNTKNGGKGQSVAYYPYVYVVLCNADSKTATGNTIMSNNINSVGAAFKIPMVEDSTEPSTKPFVLLKESRFINHLKVRLDRDLRFRVLYPNGNPVEFTEYDTHPPHIPNPNVQISANFSFKLIE